MSARSGGSARLAFGPFTLDPRSGELRRGSRSLRLPPQASRLLTLLASRPGEVVEHAEIRSALWSDTHVDFEQGTHNAVRRIRLALADDAAAPAYVQSIARRGYRFVAPVRVSTSDGGSRRWRRLAALAGLAGLAALPWLAAAWPRPAGDPPTPAATTPLAVLEGRYLLERRRPIEAEERFRAALAADPELAAAHAGLAAALLRQGARPVDRETIRIATTRALELDPGLPEARLRAGDVALYLDRDPLQAAAAYRTAVALAPEMATARLDLAAALSASGRHGEAVAELETARALDPVSAIVLGDLGMAYFWARRYAEAVAACREVLSLEPADPTAPGCVVDGLFALRRFDEARREAVALLAGRGYPPEAVAAVEAARGPAVERRYLEAVRARLEGRDPVPAAGLAGLEARLGDVDAALAWLDRVEAEGSPYLAFLAVDPHLDPLRGDPRFARLLARQRPDVQKFATFDS